MSLAPRIPKVGISKPVKHEREGMDANHLAMVRQLLCVCCGHPWAQTVEAHHLLQPGDPKERGAGRKAADKYAIPLCLHHLAPLGTLYVKGCHAKLHSAGG